MTYDGALIGRLPASDAAALVEARHPDPFSVLGVHRVADRWVVRALVPGASSVRVVDLNGAPLGDLRRTRDEGLFEGCLSGETAPLAYRLHAANAAGDWTLDDPYRFGPVLGQLDDHLLVEGAHQALYTRLGARLLRHEGAAGVHFAVWAPRAQRVSVVGDFNDWDGRRAQMRRRVDSGLWEIFLPGVQEGAAYKFEIIGCEGQLLPLKADPFGFGAELRPKTASVVTRIDQFEWTDAAYLEARARRDWRRAPVSILEVHLGSWRRHWNGGFWSYDEIADALIPYAVDMGFTHLELLPVSEHPLDESWGYQPIGLFAPTRRFGEPAAFARLIDRAHQAGLGVILDWVPAHFPVDAHGLALFDGAPLFEHADPRRGFHPDWNTAIFDFGRAEVANILIANAAYWFDVFHIDGLRVDAVASMLHLDYSRRPGEWLPNAEGGRENREAEAFLKALNRHVYGAYPGVLMIAEESTSWPRVTAPVDVGGLGFGFKWNMGWMNDTLSYMSKDPVHRRFHHDQITFGLLYAFTENFVLPLSHDEVVHGKGTVLSRMPGSDALQFAGVRAYYGFLWGYPGKKLLFMGQEFAQRREWNFAWELDWALLNAPAHAGVARAVRDLNALYRQSPALHAQDCEGEGFQWLVVDDRDQSVFAWVRFGAAGDAPVVVVCNFTPLPRPDYRIGLPLAGTWREVFNSDALIYGGSGDGNLGAVESAPHPAHAQPASAVIRLPPMSTLLFRFQPAGGTH